MTVMYGESGWEKMLDMSLVRQHDFPVRHDGAYPSICRMCENNKDDQCRVQTARGHWNGRVHWNSMQKVRNDLRSMGPMAMDLAMGWHENMLTRMGLAHAIRSHETSNVVLINVLATDWLDWTSW